MAWLWWLLAPVATTVGGAVLLWWRALADDRGRGGPGRDSISEHHALLSALAHGHPHEAAPQTLIVLTTPVAEGSVPGS
jgi:DNA-binding GntR family transcriptional regulator